VSANPPTGRARTLTEALRALSADDLARLLAHRPDLLDGDPRDLAELVGRATSPPSIARALDRLNAWQRTVAEALAALPDPISVGAVHSLLGGPRADVVTVVAELRRLALLWGRDDRLHLVRAVREAFEPYPGGLAPPSARSWDPAQIDAALDECGPEAREVLDRLLWSPTGALQYADRPVSIAEAKSPVERLLSRQLLRPLDSRTVIIPREVSWHLRGKRFTPDPVPHEPPPITAGWRTPALVDRAAAGAANELLQDLELTVRTLDANPPSLLRGGGLSSRDVMALARQLGSQPPYASFLIECASVAGLIAPGPRLTLLPTGESDRWLVRDPATRWRSVAQAWLTAPRFFSHSVETGAHTLGPEAAAPAAVELRRALLELVAELPVGTMPELDRLADAAAWNRPRLTNGRPGATTVVTWTWQEASWLGLVALGAVSSFAAAAQQPAEPLPAALAALFPTPVDRLVIQADLTAVASGPLEHAVASDLRLLADQESRGGGGVFRFSAGSLRRAFDAGWSAAEISSWLGRHSSTGVPQPLSYLVADVARRHGSVRVGPAGCYLRVDDEAQAAALLAHPSAASLGLRILAPGVLVAAVDESELVTLLRDLGHTPVVEDAAGRLITAQPLLRAARPKPATPTHRRSPDELAESLLSAERDHPIRVAEPEPGSEDDSLEQLRSATRNAVPVRIVYVDADGSSSTRELSPLDVAAGSVRAVDLENAQVITIPLSRIASVVPAAPAH
jgi:hypothetical protein